MSLMLLLIGEAFIRGGFIFFSERGIRHGAGIRSAADTNESCGIFMLNR